MWDIGDKFNLVDMVDFRIFKPVMCDLIELGDFPMEIVHEVIYV